MGLRRIMAAIEVTFPADDPRLFSELAVAVLDGSRTGLEDPGSGGTLAAFRVTGAFIDPDPVGQLPDPQPGDPAPETPPSDV